MRKMKICLRSNNRVHNSRSNLDLHSIELQPGSRTHPHSTRWTQKCRNTELRNIHSEADSILHQCLELRVPMILDLSYPDCIAVHLHRMVETEGYRGVRLSGSEGYRGVRLSSV